jgi:hypothetical protein
MIERAEFIKALETEFPEAFAKIDSSERGLLHCEVGAFREYVETKMDEGAEWYCEKAFRFIESCLEEPGPSLENALDISFIYDLAVGKRDINRHKIVKERAPKSIREKMIHVHEFWK